MQLEHMSSSGSTVGEEPMPTCSGAAAAGIQTRHMQQYRLPFCAWTDTAYGHGGHTLPEQVRTGWHGRLPPQGAHPSCPAHLLPLLAGPEGGVVQGAGCRVDFAIPVQWKRGWNDTADLVWRTCWGEGWTKCVPPSPCKDASAQTPAVHT